LLRQPPMSSMLRQLGENDKSDNYLQLKAGRSS
jgi:hypothetical protein